MPNPKDTLRIIAETTAHVKGCNTHAIGNEGFPGKGMLGQYRVVRRVPLPLAEMFDLEGDMIEIEAQVDWPYPVVFN